MQDIITAVMVCGLFVGIENKVPSYFQVCHRKDPYVSECVKKATYSILPRLKVGIPEYGIPKIEPFHLADTNFSTGDNSARVKANITSIIVYGGSTFKILNVTINPSKHLFQFKVVIPHLHGNAICDVDAKILFLTLKGKGPMHVNATDFYFDCSLQGYLVTKNAETTLQFHKMQCTADYKTVHIKFDQLFDNPTVGKATNDIVNDNISVFVEALRPSLIDAVTSRFTGIANSISSRFDYDEFFPL